MLMLSMYDRDYDLFVRDGGTAEYAVNKYGRHQMTEVFLDNFADNDWKGGFEDYLSACGEYLDRAEQGHPVRKPLMKVLPMALGIGVVLAIAVPVPEEQNEDRPSGRGSGHLCDRRGPEPDGAV